MHHSTSHLLGCPRDDTCRCETTRYLRVLAIGSGILVVEIVCGLLSGSLALIADAGHVGVDMSAVVVALAVSATVQRHPHVERQVRTGGFALAIVLLACTAAWIAIEATARLDDPPHVLGLGVIVAATLGGIGNYWQHRLLGNAEEHRTHRALHLHIKSDFVMSCGVVVSGLVVLATDWYVIDPVLSIAIALWILVQVIHLLQLPDLPAHTH